MTNFHSVFVNKVIFNTSFHQWYVHSMFDKIINLAHEHSPYLLTLTHVSHPIVPYGIHLMPHDFEQLKLNIMQGESVILSEGQLQWREHQILLQGQLMSTKLSLSLVMQHDKFEMLLAYIQTLQVKNGFGHTFKESLQNQQHLIKKIIQHKNKEAYIQQLIGRGIGLTPTGDDFLLGYCLAQHFYPDELGKKALQKIIHMPQMTTDISRHYLYCALTQHFHGLLLQLAHLLTEAQTTNLQLQQCIQNILTFGHTSGCDILTGFILSVFYMRGANY